MSFVALLLFPAAMALAASSDLLAIAINLPLQQFAMHVACALVVLAAGFAFFALRWVGGGDAKLAAATTLWLGFGLTLPYLIYAALLGGALTLAILALRRMPLTPFLARYRWLERLHDSKTGVPYGIALAVAGLLTYSNSAIFERLAA